MFWETKFLIRIYEKIREYDEKMLDYYPFSREWYMKIQDYCKKELDAIDKGEKDKPQPGSAEMISAMINMYRSDEEFDNELTKELGKLVDLYDILIFSCFSSSCPSQYQ